MAAVARLTLWSLLCLAVPAGAQSDPDAEARVLFHALMSPYCPGSLLSDCPSRQAAALRDTIRAQLRRGRAAQAIVDDLVGVYGPDILASPPLAGLGGLAWVGAVAIFLGGLGLAVWWLRRGGGPTPPPAPPMPRPDSAPSADDALRRRLQSDLAADDGT